MLAGPDVDLFRFINDAHTPALDLVFGMISGLGDGLAVALACSVLMLVHARAGGTALAAFALSGLLTQAIKHLLDVPRPPAVLEQVHVLGAALQSHSFPSGHATSDGVMIAAVLLWRGPRDAPAWALATLYLAAAIGRVYGGVHFPSDVAAGLAIGVVTMLLCWRGLAGLPWSRWRASRRFGLVCGWLVAVLAAVLGLGYPIQPSTSAPLAGLLAVAALTALARRWRAGMRREVADGG